MKPIKESEWRDIALSMLKKTSKNNPRRIVVEWISCSNCEKELGKISSLTICQSPVFSEKDYNKWQERIQIRIKRNIDFLDKEGKKITINELLKQLRKSDIKRIDVCFRVVNNNQKMIAKLFDKYYVIENTIPNFFGGHKREFYWATVKPKNDSTHIYTLSKKEAVLELL